VANMVPLAQREPGVRRSLHLGHARILTHPASPV
jgi:hypothetical protein